MHSQSRQRPARPALRIGLIAALLAAALAFSPRAYAIRFWGQDEEKAPEQKAPEPAAPSKQSSMASGLPNFADLAEALRPAVVNISTTSPAEVPPHMGMGPGGQGSPRQFGPPGQGGQGGQ